MTLWLYIGSLVLALATLIPAYEGLLRFLRADEPKAFEKMGRPSWLDGSPAKSLALQRYVYVESRAPGVSARVARICRFLDVATPVLVATNLVLLGMAIAAAAAGAR